MTTEVLTLDRWYALENPLKFLWDHKGIVLEGFDPKVIAEAYRQMEFYFSLAQKTALPMENSASGYIRHSPLSGKSVRELFVLSDQEADAPDSDLLDVLAQAHPRFYHALLNTYDHLDAVAGHLDCESSRQLFFFHYFANGDDHYIGDHREHTCNLALPAKGSPLEFRVNPSADWIRADLAPDQGLLLLPEISHRVPNGERYRERSSILMEFG